MEIDPASAGHHGRHVYPKDTHPPFAGRTRLVAVWSVVWGVLAVLHVTQSIWLSGGAAYPGDLGDGRFNQLLLEHGYQALRGLSEWISPGQFYPVRGTLAFSDTHWGTLPIYTTLRLLSVSREEAWQLWFVAVAALNAIAAFRLYGSLHVARWLQGPAVFASVGSATMVWLAGTHMQMLPVFPALLAWAEAIRWTEDRRMWRLLATVGWLGWQFAASPYSGFFAGTIGGAALVIFVAVNRRSETRPPATTTATLLSQRLGSTLVFVVGVGLAAAAAVVYATAVRSGISRNLSEVSDLAPTATSWLTASPVRFLYPSAWSPDQRDMVEQAWFPGLIALALLLVLLLGIRKSLHSQAGRWALTLGLSVVVVVLFFTKWTATGGSAWVWLASHVEAVRAFRASGRVAGLLQFALIGANVLLLTQWLSSARTAKAAVAIIAVAGLLALENVSHGQPSTLRVDAQNRCDAVVAAWRKAGDRPVLAFAPGYSNQPDAFVQLDAWSAALALHRVTINGYSGGLPGSHVHFVWHSSAANARALIARSGIEESNVSLVEELDPAAAARIGFNRQAERSLLHLADFDLQPEGWSLFAPLETFHLNGRVMHQFTPPAEVRFALPDSALHVSVDVQMREGSYSGSGHSDGVGLTWSVRSAAGTETMLQREILNPRDRPHDRGLLHRELALPPGQHRQLVLNIDGGPEGNTGWDWPLFGRLRVR